MQPSKVQHWLNSYFRQVQEQMFGRADDGSLSADLTLGLLKREMVENNNPTTPNCI